MARGWVELAHAPEIEPVPLPAEGWPVGAEIRVLSQDTDSGAVTGLLRLPPGFRRGPGHLKIESEFFLLSGSLRIGGALHEFGFYDYAPPGSTHEPWSTEAGCELLLMARNGAPDFVPLPGPDGVEGRIQLESEEMPWALSHVPGPPPGLIHKVLRIVDETGEMTVLACSVPHYDYPRLEFHDCVEEIYCVDGEIWLGNAGTMKAGSYLWRPPYITHGPFYSGPGSVILVWTPSTLINHYVDDPSRTPEENRLQVLQEAGAA
jgi:ChrR Cupin-like domain